MVFYLTPKEEFGLWENHFGEVLNTSSQGTIPPTMETTVLLLSVLVEKSMPTVVMIMSLSDRLVQRFIPAAAMIRS
ncbi:hypothetical protein [Vibrio vulnificus YJ016]|uniref:Uncharacterized protein n=1 Tax=Vibrio vulnificus (strain YJ016) TaxID=196600 RepID=Q7MDK5_VIBVY|nr:hypothetical protein [Vibrio vulnificus YJ016]